MLWGRPRLALMLCLLGPALGCRDELPEVHWEASDEVETRKAECLQHLWDGGPTETDPTRLLGNAWSPLNDVTFTLVDAEVYDWTVEGEVTWNTCESFYDNDPVVPTAPFQVPGTVAMSQASLLSGTTMSGSGPGGSTATIIPAPSDSSLTIAYLADGSLQISGLLLEAGPSMDFTNADPIVFRERRGGQWEFDPFDLEYAETGIGTWTLSFDGLLFQPHV